MFKNKIIFSSFVLSAILLMVGFIAMPFTTLAAVKTGEVLYSEAIKNITSEKNASIAAAKRTMDLSLATPLGTYNTAITKANDDYKAAIAKAKGIYDAAIVAANLKTDATEKTNAINIATDTLKASTQSAKASQSLATTSAKNLLNLAKVTPTGTFNSEKKIAVDLFNARKANIEKYYSNYKAVLASAKIAKTNGLKDLTAKYNADKIGLTNAFNKTRDDASGIFDRAINTR